MLRLKITLAAYLFLIPALVLLTLFTFYPVTLGIILSFFKYNIISPPEFVGLGNYIQLFKDPKFVIAMKNSIVYLLVVPCIQIASIALAILVNQNIRGVSLFRALYYVPVITSIVIVAIIWRWILGDNGMLNSILKLFTGGGEGIHWLTNPATALVSVMFVTFWKGIGYYMVIYLAGLSAIPPELEEASRIDGANKWQTIWHVILPLLKPSIALSSIISSIAALKVFGEIFVMTEGGPLFSTTTMVYYIYEEAFTKLHLGYASAIGVVLALAIGIFSYLNVRFFREGGLESY